MTNRKPPDDETEKAPRHRRWALSSVDWLSVCGLLAILLFGWFVAWLYRMELTGGFG